MISDVYDDVKDLEVYGFTKNTKIYIPREIIVFLQINKLTH